MATETKGIKMDTKELLDEACRQWDAMETSPQGMTADEIVADTATDRNATIKQIRADLRRRSGKAWSVTGGRGTVWGWLTITAPPARCGEFGAMTDEDRVELAALLGLDYVHHQGESVASSSAHYREYLDRAAGRTPSAIAQP